MHLRQATLQINQRSYLLLPNRSNSFDEIYVDFQQEEPAQGGGARYHIFLHPKQDVLLRGLELQFEVPMYDQRNGILTVRKDLAGWQLAHSFPALDLWIGEGQEADLFSRYFQAMELLPPAAPPALGWTSRHRPSTEMSAEKLRHDLAQLADTPLLTNSQPAYFQIEDGWQTAVGDWQSTRLMI